MCQGVLVGAPAPQLLPLVLKASVHCHIVPGDKAGVLQGVLRCTLCPDWMRCQHGVQMLGTECVWHRSSRFFLQIPCSQALFLAVGAHLCWYQENHLKGMAWYRVM